MRHAGSGDFWTPGPTGHGIDGAFALIRTKVGELCNREPPLNSASIYINDHGLNHLRSVLGHAKCLTSDSYGSFLRTDQAVLCAAIWLHDIGLFTRPQHEDEAISRQLHAERSAAFIHELNKTNPDAVSRQLADMLATICIAHRRDFDLATFSASPRMPELGDRSVRGDLIAALLRIADAADVGHGRTPAALYAAWLDRIPKGSRDHWHAHSLVHASSVDPLTAEVVLHLVPEASLEDPDLAALVVATVEDLDSTRRTLRGHGLRPWNVRFELQGQYISPAVVYGKWAR